MDRRNLMKLALNAIGAGVTLVVGIPAVLTAISPWGTSRRGPIWQSVGQAADFPLDQVTKAIVTIPRDDWARSLREEAVYVRRVGQEEYVVYSRSCTDLGCPVEFDAGSECFFCPCHGGIFDIDGERMAGPPPRPLYRYATRVENGEVQIDLDSIPPMA